MHLRLLWCGPIHLQMTASYCDIQKLHVPARAVEISKLKMAGRILGGIYFLLRQRISFTHPTFPALKGMEVLKVRARPWSHVSKDHGEYETISFIQQIFIALCLPHPQKGKQSTQNFPVVPQE